MVHSLTAEDSNLTLAIAAAGSLAALASVVVAWLVQRDVQRQRQRDDLDTAIKEVMLVRWAAHDPAHRWGEPLGNYQTVFQRVRRFNPNLNKAETLFQHSEPSSEPCRWDDEAAEVEGLAIEAALQLRQALAEHK
jgi:hypothetical protein